MNTEFTARIGSELFGTSVMKTEEAFLFVKAATEAGADLQTANDDMHMIDDLLHLKRLHFATVDKHSKTRSGNLRKGSMLYNAMDDLIQARVIHDKEVNNEC